MRYSVLAAAALSACASVGVSAQSVATLPDVRVSASPIIEANEVDAFGSLTTSVSARQIEDLNAIDAAAALRRTPGVTISRFNPVGAFGGEEGGAVYVRGMGTSRPGSEIKTYIDGLPFYMGVWNHPLLDLLPVNGMARIDVHKGPQPQAFGNTFGAVNFTPKRAGASQQGLQGDASVRVGSFDTRVLQADVLGRQGDLDYALALGHARSDGHRDHADGRLNNAMARVGYRINQAWSADVLLLAVDNRASDPGHALTGQGRGDRYETEAHMAALTVSHDHGWLQGTFQAYMNGGEGVQKPGLASKFDMQGIRWREEATLWKGGKVVVGLDVDRIEGEVDPIGFNSQSFRITSPMLAVSHTAELGQGWTVTPSAGVRHHGHNQFDSETAPHAGVVLARGEALAMRAQASRGVNYPGVDAEVLSTLIPPLAGSWKKLSPETLDHLELGGTWRPTRVTTVDAALFRNRVKNRYVFAFPPAVSAPSFLNLGDYEVQGVELSVQHRFSDQLSVFGGYTHLDPDKSDLPYAPGDVLSLGVNWQTGPWRLSVDAQAQSGMTVLGQARANGAMNTQTVGGFTVANARLAYALPVLGPRGEVFAALENAFDKTYEFRSGYPMAGRGVQVGVKASF